MPSKWAVVVPTVRPERFVSFLRAWDGLFHTHDVTLFVCADLPAVNGEIFKAVQGRKAELHHWGTIPEIFPRQTDMIRSFRIYRAWKRGHEFTLSLDDDVLPTGDPFAEYEKIFTQGVPLSPYLDVGALTSFGGQMRGFPFSQRKGKVALQYGGWNGVLDYDAPTQLAGVSSDEKFNPIVMPVPKGAALTGCAMNMAFRTDQSLFLWQLPLFEGRYNRFGDIWSCLLAKKCLDAQGFAVCINGKASVRHERASDPLANLERETPGIPLNEGIWDALSDPKPGTPKSVYRAVTDSLLHYFQQKDPDYAKHFFVAREAWLALYAT